jgi:hypothetical protein
MSMVHVETPPDVAYEPWQIAVDALCFAIVSSALVLNVFLFVLMIRDSILKAQSGMCVVGGCVTACSSNRLLCAGVVLMFSLCASDIGVGLSNTLVHGWNTIAGRWAIGTALSPNPPFFCCFACTHSSLLPSLCRSMGLWVRRSDFHFLLRRQRASARLACVRALLFGGAPKEVGVGQVARVHVALVSGTHSPADPLPFCARCLLACLLACSLAVLTVAARCILCCAAVWSGMALHPQFMSTAPLWGWGWHGLQSSGLLCVAMWWDRRSLGALYVSILGAMLGAPLAVSFGCYYKVCVLCCIVLCCTLPCVLCCGDVCLVHEF